MEERYGNVPAGETAAAGTFPSSFFGLPLEEQLGYLPLLDDWFIKEHSEKIEEHRRREYTVR